MRFDDFNELLKNSVILIDHNGNKVDAVPVKVIRKRFMDTRFNIPYEAKVGKWGVRNFPGDGTYYRCSECGCYFEANFHFCPSCGANMDGKNGTDRSDEDECMGVENNLA